MLTLPPPAPPALVAPLPPPARVLGRVGEYVVDQLTVVLLDGRAVPLSEVPRDAVVTALELDRGRVKRLEFRSKEK